MTEPTPESLSIAHRYASGVAECAREIDALTEQRVAAAVAKCFRATLPRDGETWTRDALEDAKEIRNRMAEAVDRPAPEGAAPHSPREWSAKHNPLTPPLTVEESRCSTPSQEDTGSVSGERWPDPTPEMLTTPEFEAVWRAIKTWDIGVPGVYGGYCGATGNHVRAILDALSPPTDASGPGSASNTESSPTQTVAPPGPTAGDVERARTVMNEADHQIETWKDVPGVVVGRSTYINTIAAALSAERASARAELLAQIRDDVAALLDGKIEMFSLQRPRPGQPPRWCALAKGSKTAAYGDTPAEAVQRALYDKLTEAK